MMRRFQLQPGQDSKHSDVCQGRRWASMYADGVENLQDMNAIPGSTQGRGLVSTSLFAVAFSGRKPGLVLSVRHSGRERQDLKTSTLHAVSTVDGGSIDFTLSR